MSDHVYITADQIATRSGGGQVTQQELQALGELGPTAVIQVAHVRGPFAQDGEALERIRSLPEPPRLAHCYSGCLSRTVEYLKSVGCKVAFTCCAHSIEVSKREHESLGIPYGYPHLTDPVLWERYSRGYWLADRLVAPSPYSESVLIEQGASPDRIVVIPHGVHLPESVAPLPKEWRVGYLGAIGPDKGIRYLLSAWKTLNYPDATLLLAGRDSTSPFCQHLIRTFGGGNVQCLGWLEDISEFYNKISLYCQPSASEAFGLEILEACAYGRSVVCSEGAGACWMIQGQGKQYAGGTVPAGDAGALADAIDLARQLGYALQKKDHEYNPLIAHSFSWDKIRERYKEMWRELL